MYVSVNLRGLVLFIFNMVSARNLLYPPTYILGYPALTLYVKPSRT